MVLCEPHSWGVYARPFAGEPCVFHPFKLDEIAQQFDVVIDGPMYDALDNPANAHGNAIYDAYTRGGVLAQMYDARTGVDCVGNRRWNAKGNSISLVGDDNIITEHQQRPIGALCSVQLWPWMVRNGQSVVSGWTEGAHESRAAFGLHRDGRIVFLAGIRSIAHMAELAISQGVVELGYTDGGGSTSLWRHGQLIFGPRRLRRIGSAIVSAGASNALSVLDMHAPAMDESSGVLLGGLFGVLGWIVWRSSR